MTRAFSDRAVAILQHRLDAPDAIADALEFSETEINAAVAEVRDVLNGASGIDELSKNGEAVLRDCAEGSTYFANVEDAVALGELSRGSLLADYKAAKEIEEKLGLVIPRH